MSYVSSFLISISTGIISGVISVIVWEGICNYKKNKAFKRHYAKFVGEYLAYPKYIDESKYEAIRPTKKLILVRTGNKFILKGGAFNNSNKMDILGLITMDGDHGRGYYQHQHNIGDRARFGFMEVQLSYPDILVHEIIFDWNNKSQSPHDRSEMHTDGYRWVRNEPNS